MVTEHQLVKELMKKVLQQALEGSFSKSWQQTRMVLLFKKGDPLSPLLFNLGFEPLLRHIWSSPALPGIHLPTVQQRRKHWPWTFQPTGLEPTRIKMLSYADDLQVFLTNTTEWDKLVEILQLYGRASNAKVNLNKTVVIYLCQDTHILIGKRC